MKSLRLLAITVLSLAAGLAASAAQFKAVLFTKTAGFHHESLNAGVAALQQLAKLHDFDLVWTADANRIFKDEELAKYKVVIFLLTTGDILNGEQQAAFERYIRAGGGFVGIHSGGADTEYDWPWFNRMVGHMFHTHPAVQSAVVEVLEPDFPGMDRFAKRFLFTEEWYEYRPPASDRLKYLLAVDEKTYRPKTPKPPGELHPISWCQAYDGGRAFYTGLGHLPATYGDANFMHHVYGGIYWAATGNGFSAE